MQNFVQKGDVLTFTAPSGGVVSGTGYLIGSLFVVAVVTAAAGDPFAGVVRGVATLAKASGAWTEGAKLYWDDTAKNVTTTATSNKFIGHAAAAQASGDTTGAVYCHGATT
jgi:predicted RecA/RadA family phage recombinase